MGVRPFSQREAQELAMVERRMPSRAMVMVMVMMMVVVLVTPPRPVAASVDWDSPPYNLVVNPTCKPPCVSFATSLKLTSS